MNWMKKTALVVAILAVVAVSGSMIWASGTNQTGLVNPNQPGSAYDPLVTKSYVDELVTGQVKSEVVKQMEAQIAELEQLLSAKQQELDKLLADKQKEMDQRIVQFQQQLDALIGRAGGLTVVELQPNQTLFADPGTSLIVRNGTTVAVSTDANGIPDVTGGKDLPNGTPVELNHMLIFPREGRGIKSTHSSTVFVMVTGGYKIVNPDGTIVVSSSSAQ